MACLWGFGKLRGSTFRPAFDVPRGTGWRFEIGLLPARDAGLQELWVDLARSECDDVGTLLLWLILI